MPAKKTKGKVERVFKNAQDTQAVWKTLYKHSKKPFADFESFFEEFEKQMDSAAGTYTEKQLRNKAYTLLSSCKNLGKNKSSRPAEVQKAFEGVELPRNKATGFVGDDWISALVAS